VADAASQASAPVGAVVGSANHPSSRIRESAERADLLAETMSVSGRREKRFGRSEFRMPVAARTTSFPRRFHGAPGRRTYSAAPQMSRRGPGCLALSQRPHCSKARVRLTSLPLPVLVLRCVAQMRCIQRILNSGLSVPIGNVRLSTVRRSALLVERYGACRFLSVSL
jgi:hypothetical protein